MRFLVDECSGPFVAKYLEDLGHDVYSVYEKARGIDDETVLQIAQNENRILITNDKDFGDKIYRDGKLHSGIILLRLLDQGIQAKVSAIKNLLEYHSNDLERSFVVVTEKQIRIAKR